MEKKAEDIVREIQNIDNNVNGVVTKLLKDTISDFKKILVKLVVIIILLVVSNVGIAGTGMFLIYKQIDKYNEFLSQFEYESSDYIKEVSTSNGDSIVNDGININQ